jgi:hypothetical protein
MADRAIRAAGTLHGTSFGGIEFLAFSHQVSRETYVETKKWVKSSGETAQFPRLHFCIAALISEPTIPSRAE